ncbi:MAG: cupin domain-containing protein [Microbacterium sp.]|uniref:cupin domain-containing protein n=1 Tax=Microbacterium sp. TaxID=51671 RepID=UPI003F804742
MTPSSYVVADALRGGDPQEKELSHLTSADERYTVGVWSAEPYAEYVTSHEGYEYTFVLEGRVTLTDADGDVHTFGAGDAFTIEPGWSGEYRVNERLTKHFAYYTAEGA